VTCLGEKGRVQGLVREMRDCLGEKEHGAGFGEGNVRLFGREGTWCRVW
jgi:hypothetical protein